ncbi:MAG: ribulose-phosphate 3-epimerase [Erysipelotrichaceae bacterium]|nr:ribulose-phosphate 3-epimerase [Erysipelotrichaceae bacterium]
MIVSPSVYSMHFDDFKTEMEALNDSVEWIHFDVMDAHFVPNLTFGPGICQAIRRNTDKFLDVHLMVEDPEHYAEVFAKAGADSIIFHYEVFNDIDKCVELIDKIHAMYLKAGISIKPGTPVKEILPLLDKIDIFLLMSVEPGFGGQSFMPDALPRLEEVNAYKKEKSLDFIIEVDGGVTDRNAHELLSRGAEALVAGSFVFNGDIRANVEKLRKCE